MAGKVVNRMKKQEGKLSRAQNLVWLQNQVSDYVQVATNVDSQLWAESEAAAERLRQRASIVLPELGVDLGGGGIYPFLYFLTRLTRPEVIVETGVAAGYSSWAFLEALDVNGVGRLYSSDFPYFRIKDPEAYIGILARDKERPGWELFVEGDRVNLPVIIGSVQRIDLAHFDSDKSYSGRRFFTERVMEKLSPRGVFLMDDIQDNSFFHDLVEKNGIEDYRVFQFGGKYIGMIGSLERAP